MKPWNKSVVYIVADFKYVYDGKKIKDSWKQCIDLTLMVSVYTILEIEIEHFWYIFTIWRFYLKRQFCLIMLM